MKKVSILRERESHFEIILEKSFVAHIFEKFNICLKKKTSIFLGKRYVLKYQQFEEKLHFHEIRLNTISIFREKGRHFEKIVFCSYFRK